MALTVGGIWLLADQATKFWAEWALADGPIDLFWTLRFRLITNTGASFSMGEGLGPLIGVVALIVVAALLWTGRSIATRPGAVGLGLVLGGALGNVLDRALRSTDGFLQGGVIDFVDLQWWPVFNVADVGVVVGALLLLASGIRAELGAGVGADAGGSAGDGVAPEDRDEARTTSAPDPDGVADEGDGAGTDDQASATSS